MLYLHLKCPGSTSKGAMAPVPTCHTVYLSICYSGGISKLPLDYLNGIGIDASHDVILYVAIV